MNGEEIYTLLAGGKSYRIAIDRNGSVRVFEPEGVETDVRKLTDGSYSIIVGGRSFEVTVDPPAAGEVFTVHVNRKTSRIQSGSKHRESLREIAKEVPNRIVTLIAPMPGLVGRLIVEEGSVVEKNQPLLTLEAMKMENDIRSLQAGRILKIHVKQGNSVEKGQVLVTLST